MYRMHAAYNRVNRLVNGSAVSNRAVTYIHIAANLHAHIHVATYFSVDPWFKTHEIR